VRVTQLAKRGSRFPRSHKAHRDQYRPSFLEISFLSPLTGLSAGASRKIAPGNLRRGADRDDFSVYASYATLISSLECAFTDGRASKENPGKYRGNIRRAWPRRGVEFPSAPGVSFPVAILSRTWYASTTFCFYCALTGGKDCESYLSVVTLPGHWTVRSRSRRRLRHAQ